MAETVAETVAEGAGGVVTAALLVIGDEILSGRTKDKNIGYIAEYLTNIGIDLKEVRVVPDEEPEVVTALNALRARYTYVFTTGGIGPTHDDITADCVAKAFGVAIGHDPRAVEIMTTRVRETGGVMNEARMRMTRIPAGAELVLNKISAAPGFWIGNVIVMAGVPHIMQTMLEFVTPKLKTGRPHAVGIGARRLQGRRHRHRARRRRQRASRRGDRFLSVHGREDRRQHPRGGALAGRRKACRGQGGRRGDAGAGQSGDRGRQEVAAATGRATRTHMAMPEPNRTSEAHADSIPAQKDAAPAAPQKIFPVSWDQFHRDSRALAWRLNGVGPFEAVVCITRGGLVPAAIVARELGIRVIETVCVASYAHTQQGELRVLKNIASEVVAAGGGEGASVLIVDDLVDTGQTAKIVRALLPRAHLATVYAKPMGRPMVDTFITEVSQDTWIYFPWDTGLAFQPPIREAGL